MGHRHVSLSSVTGLLWERGHTTHVNSRERILAAWTPVAKSRRTPSQST